MTSKLIVNSLRHTGASSDAITMDASGNVTFPGNATCSGTATGFGVEGITMYDVFQYTSDVQGDQQPLSSNWARAGNHFDKIGTGMSESSGIFTFPTTGKYHIWYKINFYSNGNSSQYAGAYFKVTGNNSSYTTRSHSYAFFQTTSGYEYNTAYGDVPVDVTDTTNIKVRLEAEMQNNSVYIMGSSNTIATGITFIRLGDT
jgi:hypothetical protein